jgi:hypothetical protein
MHPKVTLNADDIGEEITSKLKVVGIAEQRVFRQDQPRVAHGTAMVSLDWRDQEPFAAGCAAAANELWPGIWGYRLA